MLNEKSMKPLNIICIYFYVVIGIKHKDFHEWLEKFILHFMSYAQHMLKENTGYLYPIPVGALYIFLPININL